MITRDYLMRQIQQLIQALSLVLFHRREHAHELSQTILENTLTDVTGLSIERLRTVDADALLALCSPNGQLSGDLAIGIADLLREDVDPGSHVRARWLYEAALESGSTVPADIHDRIAALPT